MDKITYFFCITKYFNKNFNIELDKILFFPSFESLYCILLSSTTNRRYFPYMWKS